MADGAQMDSLSNMMLAFWNQQVAEIDSGPLDIKYHQLPLARIKKVMKADDAVKAFMISAEAPLMFAKACEIFILELTMRAWVVTEENKRRTLQKSDVAAAISKADMYDFLIDIVPRDEMSKPTSNSFKEPIGYNQFYPTAGSIPQAPHQMAGPAYTSVNMQPQPQHPMAMQFPDQGNPQQPQFQGHYLPNSDKDE